MSALLLAAQIITATVTYYEDSYTCKYIASYVTRDKEYHACGDTKDLAIQELKKKITGNKPFILPRDRPREKVEIKIP